MSITDELREYADTLSERARYGATIPSPFNPHSGAPIGPTKETEELYAIADRIDVEHEKAIRELNNFADAIDDACLFLPKDADGVLIHIGDLMEHVELGYVCEVIAVGADCFIAWNTHANRYCQYDSTLFRHHREPTVEDVLDEFASAYDRIGGEDEEHQKYLDLIAEYAAKLQLKEKE